jgi:hypothetical protein
MTVSSGATERIGLIGLTIAPRLTIDVRTRASLSLYRGAHL